MRIFLFIACGAGGYLGTSAFTSSSAHPKAALVQAKAPTEMHLPTAAESAFIAEWERLHTTHGGDYPAMIAAVEKMDDSFRKSAFAAALVADWVKHDPMAAMKHGKDVEQFALAWIRHDPDTAVTALLADRTFIAALNDNASFDILDAIARLAPKRLAEVFTAIAPPEHPSDDRAAKAFAIFAATDPDAARAAAVSLPEIWRTSAFAGVGKSWAEKDAAAALAWAQSMPEGDTRANVLRAVLAAWASVDPVAALNQIDLVRPGDDRFTDFDAPNEILKAAAEKNWDATIAWLRERPGKLGEIDGLRHALSRRLSIDFDGTMRLIASGAIPGLTDAFSNVMTQEERVSHDTVWSWLEKQPPTHGTRAMQQSLLYWMLRNDAFPFSTSLAYLENIPNTPENADIFKSAADALSRESSGGIDTFEFLMKNAPPHFRDFVRKTSFASHVSTTDASRWIAQLADFPAEQQAQAALTLAGKWALSDPQAALQWAATLPTGEQPHVRREIARYWAQDNFAAAADWAVSFPEGPERTSLLEILAGTLGQSKPRTAARWVEDLNATAEVRTELRSVVARSWAGADFPAATNWVNSFPDGVEKDKLTVTLVNAVAYSQPMVAWDMALRIPADSPHRREALSAAYHALAEKDKALAERTLIGSQLPAKHLKNIRENSAFGSE